jgi:catechol 2,3-dioxygenase-like lactoylglutathione lyase family enzyme
MPELAGFFNIGLRTADLSRAERFYTELLGGTVTNRRETPDRRVWLKVAGITFEVLEVPAWTPLDEAQQRSRTSIGFVVAPDQVDAIVDKLRATGVPVHGPVLKAAGTSIGVYFSDPDGTPLSLSCNEGYPIEGLERHGLGWVPGPYAWPGPATSPHLAHA